jgi:uncharacterized membrane protein (DUF441 family)
MFYMFTLASISLVSAGFCCYQERFPARRILAILSSAACLSASGVGVQFLSNIEEVFAFLLLLSTSLVSYFRDILIALLVAARLEKEINDGQVIAKLQLSRSFALTSAVTIFVTFVSSYICFFQDVDTSVGVIILEFGLILNSCLQAMRFFLRQSYCGPTRSELSRKKRPLRKLVEFVTPGESYLAIITEYMPLCTAGH